MENAKNAMARALQRAGGSVVEDLSADYVVELHLEYSQGDPVRGQAPEPRRIRVSARRTSDDKRFSARGPGLGASSASELGRWAADEIIPKIRRGR